jgi:MYXO-CTERM domain-containing protein
MFLWLALIGGPALACTSPSPYIYAWPSSEAVDVPVDATPLFSTYGYDSVALQLVDSEGVEISGAKQDGVRPNSVRFVPDAELEPEATYTLRYTASSSGYGVEEALTFTTGTGRTQQVEGSPEASLVSAVPVPRGQTAACEPSRFWDVDLQVEASEPAAVGWRIYHAFEVSAAGTEVEWLNTVQPGAVTGVWLDTDDLSETRCLAVLVEEADGSRSALSKPLCIQGVDGLDSGVDQPKDKGCGCSAAPGSSLAWSGLLLLTLAVRRRR